MRIIERGFAYGAMIALGVLGAAASAGTLYPPMPGPAGPASAAPSPALPAPSSGTIEPIPLAPACRSGIGLAQRSFCAFYAAPCPVTTNRCRSNGKLIPVLPAPPKHTP